MAQDQLSLTFAALADPTRRAILARLALGEATVNELAEPFELSLAGRLQASEGAGARRADHAGARGAVAALPAGSGAAQGCGRLARALPPVLGESFDRLDEYLRELQRQGGRPRAAEPDDPDPSRLETADREIVMTRVFDAPRCLVFRAWTEPEHLVRWLGPAGFTDTTLAIDIRPAGAWRFHHARRTAPITRIALREIVPPERLVYTFAWEEDGVPGHRDAGDGHLCRAGPQDPVHLPSGDVRERRVPRFSTTARLERVLRQAAGFLAQA